MASKRRRGKRCRFCGELFLPNPRLKARQVACSKPQCQKARKRANQEDWLKRHPGYFKRRYPNTKEWLQAHPGYQAQYRREHAEKAQRDNRLRKERHQLAQKARADIQDSISLQEPILKRLTPDLIAPPRADIQDSFWPQVVATSLFIARFAEHFRRRYTRLDSPPGSAPGQCQQDRPGEAHQRPEES